MDNGIMVFGLGTGRCGTVSLGNLLSQQPGSIVFHEMDPHSIAWEGAEAVVESTLAAFVRALKGGPLEVPIKTARHNPEAMEKLALGEPISMVGDVAFYYLPYVEMILERYPEAKFVCLKRDEDATVASYMKKTTEISTSIFQKIVYGKEYHKNHWVVHSGWRWKKAPVWDKCYPKYKARTKEEAIHIYWRDYYKRVDALIEKYPDSVRLWRTEDLNDEQSMRQILDFIRIEREQQRLDVGIRRNVNKVYPRRSLRL